MSRNNIISCDYCTDVIELTDEEITVERGWLELALYDPLREEVVHKDFCCEECLINHFP